MTAKCTIAFIGCGTMGTALAGRLINAGYELRVFDRAPEKCAPLVACGAQLAQDVASCVRDAQVVMTLADSPDEVEDLYLSHGGILEASAPGVYLIDMTATSPQLARDISEVAELSGTHAFDAPVMGSLQDAHDGALSVFCGTDEKTLAGVHDVLACVASKIVCFGAAGKGQLARLANQTALAGALVGFAEGLAFAKQSGLDLSQTLDTLAGGMAGSQVLSALGPKVLGGDYALDCTVDQYVRDIDLIEQVAESMELTLPGVDTAHDLYGVLCAIGAGKLGAQAVALMYEDEQTCARYGLDWSALGASYAEDDQADAPLADQGCGCGHDHDHDSCDCHDDDDDDFEDFDFAQAYGLESFYDPSGSRE